MQRPGFLLRLRSRTLELGSRTLVMGILNVTPDSFSDGGKFLARDHAVAHALKMLDDGADLLDIGGESTRPGTPVVESGIPAPEELRRILPVIEDVLRERPDAILSVDTYKAEVARAAVNAGVATVMSSYTDLNSVPATGNVWLLQDILRRDWDFKGFVVSDWDAVKSLEVHGFAADPKDAAVRALKAGINTIVARAANARNTSASAFM